MKFTDYYTTDSIKTLGELVNEAARRNSLLVIQNVIGKRMLIQSPNISDNDFIFALNAQGHCMTRLSKDVPVDTKTMESIINSIVDCPLVPFTIIGEMDLSP